MTGATAVIRAGTPSASFLRRRLAISVVLLVIVFSPIWNLHIINKDMALSKVDLVQVWVGVRSTLSGHDPYSAEATRQIQLIYYGELVPDSDPVPSQRFIYPAHIALILAPLGHLSWHTSYLLFLLIAPVLMVVTVPLWLDVLNMKLSAEWVFLITVVTLASWPMIWAFRLCQPTLLVAFIIATGCFLLRRGYYALAGIAFGCATVKPQLILPLIAWLLLWTALRRHWRFPIAFITTSSLLVLDAMWRVPGWIPHWRKAMAEMYVHDVQTRPMFQFMFGQKLGTVLMVCVVALGAYLLWKLRDCAPESSGFGVALALAMSLAVSLIPGNIAMIYNQVLLLPGILVLLRDPAASLTSDLVRKCAFLALAWGFLSVEVAALASSLGPRWTFLTGVAFLNPVLPILVTAAVGLQGLNRPGKFAT